MKLLCDSTFFFATVTLKIYKIAELQHIIFNSRLIPAFWLNSFKNDTNMKIPHSHQSFLNEPFSSSFKLMPETMFKSDFYKIIHEKMGIQALSGTFFRSQVSLLVPVLCYFLLCKLGKITL